MPTFEFNIKRTARRFLTTEEAIDNSSLLTKKLNKVERTMKTIGVYFKHPVNLKCIDTYTQCQSSDVGPMPFLSVGLLGVSANSFSHKPHPECIVHDF